MPRNRDSGENINTTEEEGMKESIVDVSKSEDLSPRHADNLMAKKGNTKIPLQVQTSSSKSRTTSCDQ